MKSSSSNTISLIIPCYNEWSRLADLVRHVFSVFDNKVQIIVSDQSQDQIISDSLEKYKNNLNSQQSQNFIYTKSPGSCRAETLNYGAGFANGDILLFLHADNQLPIEAKRELEEIDLVEYIGWCFQEFAHPNMTLVWLLEVYWNRHTRRTLQFFGANAMWIKKDVFHELWWFAKMRLFEDVDLNDKMRTYVREYKKKLYISPYITLISSRKFKERGFWSVFFLQIKLIIKYRLGLYTDEFEKEYYR